LATRNLVPFEILVTAFLHIHIHKPFVGITITFARSTVGEPDNSDSLFPASSLYQTVLASPQGSCTHTQTYPPKTPRRNRPIVSRVESSHHLNTPLPPWIRFNDDERARTSGIYTRLTWTLETRRARGSLGLHPSVHLIENALNRRVPPSVF